MYTLAKQEIPLTTKYEPVLELAISTEVQTLRAIRIQLYHQCFEQVWQHNFTSIIGLRRSTQRPSIFEAWHIDHPPSKVDTSIVDLRKLHIDLRRSTYRSPIFEGRHIDPRSSKVETSIFEDRRRKHRTDNLTSYQHSDNSSRNIVHHGAP